MSCYKTIRISCIYQVEKVVGEQPKNSLCFFWENSKKKVRSIFLLFSNKQHTNDDKMTVLTIFTNTQPAYFSFDLVYKYNFRYLCLYLALPYLSFMSGFLLFLKEKNKKNKMPKPSSRYFLSPPSRVCMPIYLRIPYTCLPFLFLVTLSIFQSKEEERKQEDHLCFFLSCLYSLHAFSTRSHLSVLLLWMTWLERKKSSMVFGSKKIVKCVYIHMSVFNLTFQTKRYFRRSIIF